MRARKIISLVLVILFCFVSSGIVVLATPKPVQATWPQWDVAKVVNDVLTAIWKLAIFPLIKKFVLKLASGDLNINGLEMLSTLGKDMAFQAVQATLMSWAGLSLCSEIKANVRIAFARAGGPGDYVPQCTYDRSLIKKAELAITEMTQTGKTGTDAFKVLEREFFQRFALTMEGDNNDYSTWFGMRSNMMNQLQKKEDTYRLELLVNNGFLGSRDCQNLKPDTKVAKSADKPKNPGADDGDDAANKEAIGGMAGEIADTPAAKAEPKPVDKYADCKIKSPGLMFASVASENLSSMQKGTLGATAFQDVIALTGLAIDTVIQTALTGIWNQMSGQGNKPSQSEPTSTQYQSTGQNRQLEIPKEQGSIAK